MLDEAREALADLADDHFAALPRDAVWPACISFLADVTLAVGDREQAAPVYDELSAYEGRNLMVGMTISFGPADRYLGNLAALLGRPQPAARHLDAALSLARRSGSPVWEARALHDQARFLAAQGETERARRLSAQAHGIAVEIGMEGLARATEAGLLSAHGASDGLDVPDGLSGRELDVLRLVARGESNRVIGEHLHISQNTVANHVRAILQKTGCTNRTEAAAYAVRHEVVIG
jgi:ATP/maltotriose-dependent transcriptional regulator MalT